MAPRSRTFSPISLLIGLFCLFTLVSCAPRGKKGKTKVPADPNVPAGHYGIILDESAAKVKSYIYDSMVEYKDDLVSLGEAIKGSHESGPFKSSPASQSRPPNILYRYSHEFPRKKGIRGVSTVS